MASTANIKAVISAEDRASSVLSGVGGAFNKVMSGIQVAVQATSVVIGAALTSSLSGAISRVDTLNNASRVFQDMGFSADQVTKSTDALKQSILGLPTALNEGISNVQQLAASTGNLDKSQKLFTAMNDAILGFGGNTNDVNSAVLQLSQDLSRGTITAGTFNSMLNAQMGPALSAVAKSMNITAAALKDGLSNGSISVTQFEDALISLDQNGGGGLVSLHQIALQSTQGISTSFANMRTAMVRGMADILQAVGTSQIAQMISGIGTAIEGVEKKVSLLIAQFKHSGGSIQDFAGVALPVLGLLGGSLSPLLRDIPVVGSMFESLTGPIGLVLGLVGGLIASSPGIRNGIGEAFGVLTSTVSTLGPMLEHMVHVFFELAGTVGQALGPVIVKLSEALMNLVLALAPLIPPLMQIAVVIIQDLLLPLLPAIAQLLVNISGAFVKLMDAIMPIMPVIVVLVGQLADALVPAIGAVIGFINWWITQLEQGNPLIQGLTIFIAALVAGIWIYNTAMAIAAAATTAWATATGILGGVLAFVTSPIGLVILAVAALAAIVFVVITNWSKIAQFFSDVWKKVSDAFTVGVNAISNATNTVITAVLGFIGMLGKAIAAVWNAVLLPVFTALITIVGAVGLVFERIFAFILLIIVGTIAMIIQAIMVPLTFIYNFIVNTILIPIWTFFVMIFTAILNFLVGVFIVIGTVIAVAFNLFYLYIVTPVTDAINFVMGIFNAVLGWLGGVLAAIAGTIGGAFATAYNAVAGWVSGIFNSVSSAFGGVLSFLGGIGAKVIKTLSGAGGWLVDTGKNMIQGLLDGAGSLIGTIGSFFLSKLPDWIKDPFKQALGIHSPSKVFAGYGQNIVDGLTGGIYDNLGKVTDAASSLSIGVQPTGQSMLNGVGSNSALSTQVNAQAPTINITIQAGAFLGSQMEARKFATMIMDAYQDAQAMKGATA
jgi:tape measure domain-containing protein